MKIKVHKKLWKKMSQVISGKKKLKKKNKDEDDKGFIDSLPNTDLYRPQLRRTMSNSEQKMEFMEGFHVNSKKVSKVNLATPGRPDHTYSAVAFNIHGLPTGKIIKINGFSVGGELGRIRVYICVGELCHRVRGDKSRWNLIYDKRHPNSMAQNDDLFFDEPVILGPEQTCAFYIHSDKMNDRGLKYRSCRKAVVHVDDAIAITRGYAHTSPMPFNQMGGWYRENRVLSGVVYYEAVPILWTNFCHYSFPQDFQHAVIVIRHALCEELYWNEDLVDQIIIMCPFDWFGVNIEKKSFLKQLNSAVQEASQNPFGRSGWDGFW